MELTHCTLYSYPYCQVRSLSTIKTLTMVSATGPQQLKQKVIMTSNLFTWYPLTAAPTTENLPTDPAVMPSSQGTEPRRTLVALPGNVIRHPITSQLGVRVFRASLKHVTKFDTCI